MTRAVRSGPAVTDAAGSESEARRRRQRILSVANSMITAGGEGALQMKELADRAQVSLTTLYRDYSSKDHVLLELAQSRYNSALRELRSGNITIQGETPGERAADYLIRQFRRQQREPEVTAALVKGLTQTDRACSAQLEVVGATTRLTLLTAVWGDPAKAPAGIEPLLDIISAVMGKVTRGWLTGVMSATEARTLILTTTALLDLDDATRAGLLRRAAADEPGRLDSGAAVGGW